MRTLHKPFVVIEGADLATVLQQQLKKQTHSVLLSIHPATCLHSQKWVEFEMTRATFMILSSV